MDIVTSCIMENYRRSLTKPLDGEVLELLKEIESKPALYIGNDQNVRCLFHFLNGWGYAKQVWKNQESASLNEKMNAFLALNYNDLDSLNWAQLLIRHEGEEAAYGKFFEYLHVIDH